MDGGWLTGQRYAFFFFFLPTTHFSACIQLLTCGSSEPVYVGGKKQPKPNMETLPHLIAIALRRRCGETNKGIFVFVYLVCKM